MTFKKNKNLDMKKIFYLLFPFLLFSCNKDALTETIAKSKITEFYGGKIDVAKMPETNGEKNASKYQIIITNSSLIDSDSENANFHAGNIAWLFYHNLGAEKKNYPPIRVTEIIKNGKQKVYNFTLAELQEIDKLYRQVAVTNEFLIKNNTAAIVAEFDKKDNISQKDLDDLLESVYKEFGIIKEIQFQGFAFEEDEDLGEVINIKETLVMEKNNIALHLYYDRKTKKLVSFYIP